MEHLTQDELVVSPPKRIIVQGDWFEDRFHGRESAFLVRGPVPACPVRHLFHGLGNEIQGSALELCAVLFAAEVDIADLDFVFGLGE